MRSTDHRTEPSSVLSSPCTLHHHAKVKEEEARADDGKSHLFRDTDGTKFHCATVAIGTIAVLLKGLGHSGMISYTRLVVWIFRSTGRRHAGALLMRSLYAAVDVFVLMFALVGFCALESVLLFRTVLTEDTNTETYQDAIIAMFVFVTTGENYVDVSEKVLAVSKGYFILLMFTVVVGIFFVMSMVIAIFEAQYNEDKDRSTEANSHGEQRMGHMTNTGWTHRGACPS